MSIEEQEKHAYYDEASNPDGEFHRAAKGEEVGKPEDRPPEKSDDSKKEPKNDPHISAQLSIDMMDKHINAEKLALQTEHPTPEELLALAYVEGKAKNSDRGSAMQAEGVPSDLPVNA